MNSTTLFAYRPPVDLPPARPARVRVAGVGRGCGCAAEGVAASVMADVGMTHAAAMHADPSRDWTAADWRAHVGEEHDVLFPLLLEAGRGAGDPTVEKVVARLEADHAVYLDRLDRGLPLPRGGEAYSVDVHGRVEDGLVRQHATAIRALAGKSAGVGGMAATPLAKSSTTAALGSEAAPKSSSSWWPIAIGGALGAGAWVAGLGPLGIALSAFGGTVGTGVVQKIVAAPPAKAAPAPPPRFLDPETYFAEIAAETKALADLKASRDAENDERVQSWKRTAKEIPYIGPFTGALIDLGAWLGKKLGSNYAEQNSQEDLDQAGTWIVELLARGFVPPALRFNEKDGARDFNQETAKTLEDLSYMTDDAGDAVRTMGLMTIARSADPAVQRAVREAAGGNGSLGAAGVPATTYGGTENVAAGVASSVYGVPYDELLAFALKAGATPSTRYSASYYRTKLNRAADVFIATMRRASDRHYGVAP